MLSPRLELDISELGYDWNKTTWTCWDHFLIQKGTLSMYLLMINKIIQMGANICHSRPTAEMTTRIAVDQFFLWFGSSLEIHTDGERIMMGSC